MDSPAADHFDFAIIGSGFGGSVCALRLLEKGYRVLMLEKGSELGAADFPKTNWNLRRWLWAPIFGCRGLFQIRFFRHVTVLAGAGVGGGSLTYANTLPIPRRGFYEHSSWADLADWEAELAPHYATARRMLGAAPSGFLTASDRLLQTLAQQRGTPEAFEPPHVAVFMGEPGKTVPDPYFAGEGPDRTGCVRCGSCMTGCRHGAKNSLDKNYLYFARKRGLVLHSDTEVTHVAPDPQGGYSLTARAGRNYLSRVQRRYRAQRVIFAAGALGTNALLLRLKGDPTGLPALSDRLGTAVRTNSESLIFVTAPQAREDYSQGIAINSLLQTDAHSHLELVRYGAGSGFFRLMALPHVSGSSGTLLLFRTLAALLRHPLRYLRAFCVRDWAKSTLILLFMRSTEGTLRFVRSRLGFMTTRLDAGEAPKSDIPEASALARVIAQATSGIIMSPFAESLFGIPTTAHILGGCPMGDAADRGVIDTQHRVFNYPGLYVVDGAAVSANPGVNPSLTIMALAERAMSLIPKPAWKDAADAPVSTVRTVACAAADDSASAAPSSERQRTRLL